MSSKYWMHHMEIDSFVEIDIKLTRQSQIAHIEFPYQSLQDEWNHHKSTHKFRDVNGWERLGAAFGRNIILRKLQLKRLGEIVDSDDSTDEEFLNWDNDISDEVFQCIEAFYRGILSNKFIDDLDIDMDLFPCDGSLPTLNLQDAQFKERLYHVKIRSNDTISTNQSHMIRTYLESTSMRYLSIYSHMPEESFRIIMISCTKLVKLTVRCVSLPQCAALASLLRDPRSILSKINLYGDMDEGGLATIAEGLTSNTTLMKLSLCDYSGDLRPMAKALCDNSTIERIVTSNHTLTAIDNRLDIPPLLQKYLALNRKANKDLVIRKKISLYYFRGEYDVSTFASMDIKCLPRVLAIIGGDETIENAEMIIWTKRDNPSLRLHLQWLLLFQFH
eukprot:scaffold64050_cov37-Cyclotella_meneghiniana.AAC.7